MDKSSLNLIIIHLNFLFKGMNEADQRFNNLNLFSELNVVKSKIRQLDNSLSFSIRISTKPEELNNLISIISSKITSNISSLLKMGLEDGVNLELNFEYFNKVSLHFNNLQLHEITKMTGGFPSISINSIQKSYDYKTKAVNQKIFHQIIINSKKLNKELPLIKNIWNTNTKGKYTNNEVWSIKSEDLVILNIKEILGKFKWNEIELDIYEFIKINQNYFTSKNMVINYGFFQQNVSDMSGGEVGKDCILKLLELGIGLNLTLSDSSPVN